MTADALHAQRGHARFLVEDKKAHYALCVKKNQAGPYERLQTLPWKQVTAKSTTALRETAAAPKTAVARSTPSLKDLIPAALDLPHALVLWVTILMVRADSAYACCVVLGGRWGCTSQLRRYAINSFCLTASWCASGLALERRHGRGDGGGTTMSTSGLSRGRA